MPSSGDTLSLGKLGYAVGSHSVTSGASQTALAADGRGSTGTETKLSHFYIAGVTSMTVVNPADEIVQPAESWISAVNFTSPGSLFASRIGDRIRNFSWTETSNPGRIILAHHLIIRQFQIN